MSHSRKRKMIPNGNRQNKRIYKYGAYKKGTAIVFLFAGGQEVWEEAKSSELLHYKEWLSWPGNILCLPEIQYSSDYRYPVQGLDVLVWLTRFPDEISINDLDKLVRTLLSDGARSVYVQSIYAESIEPDNKPYFDLSARAGVSHG